jgi:Caspase domain.
MAKVRRAALLIGAPALEGHDYLRGVDSDMAALKQFLYSTHGGGWDQSEVVHITNPTRATIFQHLSNFERTGTNYFFCAFGGHGHHPKSDNVTSLCINDKEEIGVSEIFPNITRQTILVDACRHVTEEKLELSMKSAAFAEAARTLPLYYFESCRKLFDDAVLGCETGRIELYSCNLDESASDGLFTPALVECSAQWGIQNAPSYSFPASKILDVSVAFRQAFQRTIAVNKLQHPQFVPGRRMTYFPFAVS